MLILKSYKTGLLVDVTLNALVLPADKIGSDRGNRGVPLMTAIDFPLQAIPVRARGLDVFPGRKATHGTSTQSSQYR